MDEPIKTYCKAIKHLDDVHRVYHETKYGFPVDSDDELFERLILEINQAGLSWTTILKKQANFRKAYSGFAIKKVAGYGQKDRERLLSDAGIIRNKLKVNAAIHNAQQIINLQKDYGSFKSWLDYHHPKTREEWVKLFKKTFCFTGGEITNEFLLSTGYLKGAHESDCHVFKKILNFKPMWMQ